MYELNSIGKLVWKNCDQYDSVDHIVCSLDAFFIHPLTELQKQSVKDYCQILNRRQGHAWQRF